MWRPKVDVEVKDWCQGSSSICFHFIFGEGVSHLNSDLTDLSSLPRQYPPGIPRLRLHCAEIVDGPPGPIGGNWGSQVQCLYSHHARSQLPSPLRTVRHSLLLLVVTCLLSCSASSWASFGQECLPLAQCFSHFWLIGIQSHFPCPLSLMSALPSFSFYVLGLHPYFSHHCSWLVNIYIKLWVSI